LRSRDVDQGRRKDFDEGTGHSASTSGPRSGFIIERKAAASRRWSARARSQKHPGTAGQATPIGNEPSSPQRPPA